MHKLTAKWGTHFYMDPETREMHKYEHDGEQWVEKPYIPGELSRILKKDRF